MKLPETVRQIINTPITSMDQLRIFIGILPSLMVSDKSGRITEMVKDTLDSIVHGEVEIARKERLKNGVK